MRNAIMTKYIGPNHRASRIRVTCDGHQPITRTYDHGLDAPGNHREALCTALVAWGLMRPDYEGPLGWVGGCLPDGRGYAWVDGTADGMIPRPSVAVMRLIASGEA